MLIKRSILGDISMTEANAIVLFRILLVFCFGWYNWKYNILHLDLSYRFTIFKFDNYIATEDSNPFHRFQSGRNRN